MEKIELSPAFLVGHEVVDAQHAELVDALNALAEGYILKDVDVCRCKWREFCKKLERHFICEEKIMKDFDYSDEGHEQEHIRVLKQIRVMAERYAHGQLEDWKRCFYEMEGDILGQILKHDLKFAQYLYAIGYNKY